MLQGALILNSASASMIQVMYNSTVTYWFERDSEMGRGRDLSSISPTKGGVVEPA